ncbi:MAG: dual specificity protein phosphatase family protein, partial [Verrucomicrobia bacterium]|nr:dual specificity protein phosphatase family protein [Verrucomicrobiota bacterium]
MDSVFSNSFQTISLSSSTGPSYLIQEKTQNLAKLTFSNIGEALKNSIVFRTLTNRSIVVGTALVFLAATGVLATPPGWVIAAVVVVLVASVALSLYLQKDKVQRELSPLRGLGFHEINFSTEEITNRPTMKEQQIMRGLNQESTINTPKGKIFLGTLPNKLSSKMRNWFNTDTKKHVLSILEDWEKKPVGFSVPWSKKELEDANITVHNIDRKDHSLLSIEELNKAADTIYDAISKGEDIYVHCKAGQGRSPVAVAAYLIKYENLNVTQAINLIKKARPITTIEKRKDCLLEFLNSIPMVGYVTIDRSLFE